MPTETTPLETPPTQDQEQEQALPELEEKAAEPPALEPEPPVEGEAEPPAEEPPEEPSLPEDWEDNPTIQAHLKEVSTEAYNRAKSHLTRSHSATIAEIEATHQDELARARDSATASELVRQFASTLGDLDPEDDTSTAAVRKLLQSSDSWAKVFLGTQERDAQATLARAVTSDERWTKDLSDETNDEFRASVAELSSKLRSRVARAESREEVTKAYAESLGSYLETRDQIRDKIIIANALAQEKKRLEGLVRKAATATRGGAPPAKPPSGSTNAVSNDNQKRLDRLALGRDSDGNAPTAEDRAWLAARE